MRFNLLASLLISMSLTGCAFEGTVVEKRSRFTPDSSLPGPEGVNAFVFRGPTGTSRPPITVPDPQYWADSNGRYSFLLRDKQGRVRSQMVTAGVFARYRVGDYFNDQQAPPQHADAKNTTVAVVTHHRQPHRVARTNRSHRTHRKVVTHRRHHSTKSRKVVKLRTSHPIPQG